MYHCTRTVRRPSDPIHPPMRLGHRPLAPGGETKRYKPPRPLSRLGTVTCNHATRDETRNRKGVIHVSIPRHKKKNAPERTRKGRGQETCHLLQCAREIFRSPPPPIRPRSQARPISSSSSVRRDVHVQTKGGRERSPSGKVRCTQYESLLGLGTCLLGGVKLRWPQLDEPPAVAAASSSSWRTRS